MWDEAGVTPRESFIDLSKTGTKLRIQETGDGPPIVFVHGASNSSTSWCGLAAALPDYRCVMIDRPGCGLSEFHGRRFDDVAELTRFSEELVADIFDALGLEEAHLLGTSYGGNVVLRAAAAMPDRISKLVCLGWSVGAPVAYTPMSMRMANIPGLGGLMFKLPAPKPMIKAILKQVGLKDALANGKVSDAFLTAFQSLINDTDTMANELRQGPPLMTPIKGFNDSILIPDDALARVTPRTLFLWGTNDPMGGETIAAPFAAKLPNATLEMFPGGHAIWVDDADGVAAKLRAFLAS